MVLDPVRHRVPPRLDGLHQVSTEAIQDLLKRTESHPILGPRGEVVTNGFSYSRDELIALLQECSKHTAIGVHSIDHYDPTGDGTSLRITVYATFARSEVDMPNRKV